MHAFEPVPPVADICRANVAQYMPKGFTVGRATCVWGRLVGGVTDSSMSRPVLTHPNHSHPPFPPAQQLHQVALADKTGEVDITYFPDCSVNSTIGKADAKQGNVSKDPERIATTVEFMKNIQSARARFDYYFMRFMPLAVQRWCLEFFAKEKMKNKEVFKVPVKTISDMIRETKVEKIDVLKVGRFDRAGKGTGGWSGFSRLTYVHIHAWHKPNRWTSRATSTRRCWAWRTSTGP